MSMSVHPPAVTFGAGNHSRTGRATIAMALASTLIAGCSINSQAPAPETLQTQPDEDTFSHHSTESDKEGVARALERFETEAPPDKLTKTADCHSEHVPVCYEFVTPDGDQGKVTAGALRPDESEFFPVTVPDSQEDHVMLWKDDSAVPTYSLRYVDTENPDIQEVYTHSEAFPQDHLLVTDTGQSETEASETEAKGLVNHTKGLIQRYLDALGEQ